MKKCPFLRVIENEYIDVDGIITLGSQTEDYHDCYEEECMCYRYDISKGGFYCAKVDNLDLPDIYDEE